ncbi:hypothetical protein PGT21_019858 [Puccinia graminis f. sp. tritici]|uniref:Uncharacterized protein n=1 Tax=Puccinia graminis f. sp. tritici TaxID=56615 RepID=A0A5B0ML11_PUCGR|nr:hypothetical protein PGT21_019858 [Puccinia graminis f. sp. tritici]
MLNKRSKIVCKCCPPSTTIPDQLAHQKPTATHSQDWIALVEHGDLFVDKGRYPQNSGAPAVIVCDWQQSPTISSSSILTLTHILSTNLWSTHDLRSSRYQRSHHPIGLRSQRRDSYLSLRQDWKEFSAISDQPFPHQPTADLDHLQSSEVIIRLVVYPRPRLIQSSTTLNPSKRMTKRFLPSLTFRRSKPPGLGVDHPDNRIGCGSPRQSSRRPRGDAWARHSATRWTLDLLVVGTPLPLELQLPGYYPVLLGCRESQRSVS